MGLNRLLSGGGKSKHLVFLVICAIIRAKFSPMICSWDFVFYGLRGILF